ncbi:MAG: RiPP maturation radical SAM C-methyltransferase [Acidobacteria bacterium]|jgi:magnesium-protoporphyrin IX monomethyl ester (oxidative) cyclase|nr:RiPP maturation radical SAM C-methyltransferase [Acidobacteriota bacterium]
MKIALLILPFHLPELPSLGLTQIKGRVKEIFADQVDVNLLYLNHDFYKLLGEARYSFIDNDSTYTCINDWLFRNEAFDGVNDNQKEYLKRFYPQKQFIADMLKDLNLSAMIQQMIMKYKLDSYDLIGINAAFSLTPGLAFCRHLKKRNPRIVTVMGCAALHGDMGLAVSKYYPYVDYVCSGPGLISFPKLIQGILNGSESDCDSIPGIFSKRNFQKVEKVSEFLDIDVPISLDYTDFLESFRRLDVKPGVNPMIILETSRGCYWNKCTFCGLSEDQREYQLKSFDKAIEEINYYMEKFDCDILMADNIMPRSYIKKVLPYLRIPDGRNLVYEVRGDYDDEDVKMLKQAHITKIQPGIESLVTPVHKVMNKGVTAFQCIHMLKLCLKYGITPVWNIIFGFPGMTGEMYEQMIRVIPRLMHLYPPGTLTPVRFDRYGAYWRDPAKYDLLLVPFAAYGFIYPYDEEFLSNIAYFFVDKNNFSPAVELISRYYIDLKVAVDTWTNRWQPGKTADIPQLYHGTRNNVPYIYDSRGNTVKEYELTGFENEMLKLLEKPYALEKIKESFPARTDNDMMLTLRSLENKELVFKEEDRYLGLVMWD